MEKEMKGKIEFMVMEEYPNLRGQEFKNEVQKEYDKLYNEAVDGFRKTKRKQYVNGEKTLNDYFVELVDMYFYITERYGNNMPVKLK